MAVQPTSTTDAFLDAMAELARGVALVTCSVGDRTWGTTITSLTSVSLEPPTMLIALTTESRAARAIAAEGWFGIVLLGHDQVQLARVCAVAGAAKFVDDGQLDGAAAGFECEVVGTAVVGETTVFYGSVRSAWADAAGKAPLLHHRRRYAWLSS